MKYNKKILFLSIFIFFTVQLSYSAGKTNIPILPEKANKSDITEKEINYPIEFTIPLMQEEESDPVINLVVSAISSAAESNETKGAVLETEALYRRAVAAFKNGKSEDVKKYFSLFMKKLETAQIDPGIYFFLFDDFDNIITKLKRIYTIDMPSPVLESEKYSIPMECKDNSLVEKYIGLYSTDKPKERIKAAIERSGAYREIVLKALQDFNLPQELIYLPVVESLYNNRVVSKAGAVGIWQIMAHRGRGLNLKINYWIDERRDPEKATRAACLYLKELYLMLNDWHLVLASYNRGEYGLLRDMKFSNASNITEMTDRNAIPKETQQYVPQFIAVVTLANNPEKYGFDNIKFHEPLKYDKIKTDRVIDLKIAAQCAETTLEEIKMLNPALNAWCTPQGYPGFELKIPYGTKAKFLENIAKIKDLNPSPGFIKHKVKKGEYIEKIALEYKTTPKEIFKDNQGLSKKKYLQIGQIIVIRPGRNYFK
ncbi:MAG: transglycosylase SLT domain-containing protein [Endomicrobium sp.]|jgi:membrane-bound lytic murein transglycosylase D|nr:transglycosylase SLT domain-containing protein [Endomicrobium sp.]